ncbi:hypothetical protein EJ06DRAFT_509696 [Trichodelitschia bisporula]|uniref:Peroxisomal membrane protein Pex17 n=1 Tax=Trichodelitschia bisporula TaxID=703511 RepID=A0A6G1HYA6_9PEZI|nr:hypothetical protein EJ06DRAFT_509696 [Trichodelitschia bisporula]
MPADRILETLLRSLQTWTAQQDTPVILSTAAALLTRLHNPLNVTLLTAHLLTAPALWERPDGLQTVLRIVGVFHAAAQAIIKREHEAAARETGSGAYPYVPEPDIGLPAEAWMRAVVAGADERSERWKHVLVLGGLVIGFGDEGISASAKRRLGEGFVRAVNMALAEGRGHEELGGHAVALTLNHAFPLLGDGERAGLDWNLVLPVLVGSAFFSHEGLQSAYFIGAIDLDILEGQGKLSWAANTTSFYQVEQILKRPLVSSLGPLSRLIAHAVEHISDPWIIQTMVEDLTGFTRSLIMQWRQIKLSRVDVPDEAAIFPEETLKRTIPTLWKLLKAALFALVIVFRGAVGRLLNDRVLASDAVAPILASQVLHSLRNVYFIASRLGTDSLSQYTFISLASIDILSNYPPAAGTLLSDIAPPHPGTIPPSPLDRTLDHYFLNTAEHFTLILPLSTSADLLLPTALPYLTTPPTPHTLPIFEAAHSVALAVFAAPHAAPLAAEYLPTYVSALFNVFPAHLSPRQFRLAFKTLLRTAAPPAPLAASQPDLPAIVLELLHHRAGTAGTTPLAPRPGESEAPVPLSEQAVLVLTLLDALPFLPVPLLEEWLPLAAGLVRGVGDAGMRDVARTRFWEVLVGGEMDAERAMVAAAWWGTWGGREAVLYDGTGDGGEYLMSGGLGKGEESKL